MRTVIIYILLVLAIALQGCRVKKKSVERENVKIEKSEVKSIAEQVTKDVVKDSTYNQTTKTIIAEISDKIKVTKGNIDTLIISKEVKGNKVTYTTNGQNIEIDNTLKTTSKKDSISVERSEVDKSKTTKSENTSKKEQEQTSKRKTDTLIFGIPLPITIGIGLGLLAVIIIIYLRKKSMFL